MSHRTDAEGSIDSARVTLAELAGQLTPTDITMANAARAQAIATAAVAQALLALDDTLAARAQAQQPPTTEARQQTCGELTGTECSRPGRHIDDHDGVAEARAAKQQPTA